MSKYRNRCYKYSNILIFLLLIFLFTNTSSAAAPYYYVGYTGNPGDVTCDGTNDEVQIQAAFNYINSHPGTYTTVYLRGPHTYWIDNPMAMYSNTKLTGDSGAEIKLVANAAWPKSWKDGDYTYPLIRNGETGSNFEISVITIDGNSEYQTGVSPGTGGYYTMVWFDKGCSNIYIHNMRFEWGDNDAVKIYGSTDGTPTSTDMKIRMVDNVIYRAGHEAGYFLGCKNVTFARNDVETRANGAARVSYGGRDVYFYDNDVWTYSGGSTGPGFEVDKTNFYNINIYNNEIHDLRGAAVWLTSETASGTLTAEDIRIYNNRIYNVGTLSSSGYSNAGIVSCQVDNILIENNVIDDGGQGGVKFFDRDGTVVGSGYNTIVRNNIIMYCDTSPGAALWNALPSGYASTHTITAYNNVIYANTVTYSGSSISLSSNLYSDPSVYSRSSHDYHIKSRGGRYYLGTWVNDASDSNCIDAGYASSSYANEPSPNGGRINIGAYGNTIYASKTYTTGGSAPTGVFNATPSSISSGGSSTLSWSSSGATSATISGVGTVATSGNTSVSPTTTTTYTLSLSNSYGTTTYTATVTVSGTASELLTADTRIKSSEATSNFNSLAYIDLGDIDDLRQYRGLYAIDLTGYTTPVKRATLWLYWYYPPYEREKTAVVEVYRPAAAWNVTQVTWNNRLTGTAWSNVGGSWYDINGVSQGTTPYANVTIWNDLLPGTGSYMTFDITQLVNQYIAGTYTNTGILLKAQPESQNYIAFASLENGESYKDPFISISYNPSYITSFSPADTTPYLGIGESETFNVQMDNASKVTWYLNGTWQRESDYTGNYDCPFTFNTIGYYNVTAKTNDDQQIWIVNVGNTPSTGIISYIPVSLTPQINIGSTQTFTVTTSDADVIYWYNDDSLVEIDSSENTANYQYTPTSVNTFNITAISASGDQVTWDLESLHPPFAITSTTPSDIVVSYSDDEKTFTANTNIVANITWYQDDNEMETDVNTTSASFTYTHFYGGVHTVRAYAVSYNQTDENIWYWTVRGPSENDTEPETGGTNQEKIDRIKVDLVSNIDAAMRLAGILIVVTLSCAIIALLVGVWQKRIKVGTACAAILVMSVGGGIILIGLQILGEFIKHW